MVERSLSMWEVRRSILRTSNNFSFGDIAKRDFIIGLESANFTNLKRLSTGQLALGHFIKSYTIRGTDEYGTGWFQMLRRCWRSLDVWSTSSLARGSSRGCRIWWEEVTNRTHSNFVTLTRSVINKKIIRHIQLKVTNIKKDLKELFFSPALFDLVVHLSIGHMKQ